MAHIRLALAAVLGAFAVVAGGPGWAATPRPSPALPGAFAQLAGSAVSSRELGGERAKGIAIGNVVSSADVSGNSVGAGTHTGQINDGTDAVTGNTGITTVFQNTGNNALLQNSMSITITVH